VLALFRTNQASAGLFLFFYALLLQLPAWFAAPALATNSATGGLGGKWLMTWLGEGGLLVFLLPVVLVTLQGIAANVLVTRHRMSRKVTQFPGMFIVLCWALVPAFRLLHPVQVASLLLLLALLSLGRVYKKDESAVPLFNAGAWVGLASLFCPAFLLLLPVFIIGIGKLRQSNFRSTFQLLVGVGLVYFLTLSWCYFQAYLTNAIQLQFSVLNRWWFPPIGALNYAGLISLGVLFLTNLLIYGPVTRLLNMEGKKNADIQLWLLLFSSLSLLLSAGGSWAYLQVICVPVGIIIGLRFTMLPDNRAEFLHLILVTVATIPLLWQVFG
jgi:hypothetical protein